MKTWAVLAAKHATLTSGVGFSMIPGLGTASLDGFALGALLAGAYFATVNSPRRGVSAPFVPVQTRRRQAAKTRTSRGPAGSVRSGRVEEAASEEAVRRSQRSRVSVPLGRVLARPSFLSAPAFLPAPAEGRAPDGRLVPADGTVAIQGPLAADVPVPAEGLVQAERPVSAEGSVPVEVPAPADGLLSAEWPVSAEGSVPDEVPVPGERPAPAERSELSRPYSVPWRTERISSSGFPKQVNRLSEAESSWRSGSSERSEDSHPYARLEHLGSVGMTSVQRQVPAQPHGSVERPVSEQDSERPGSAENCGSAEQFEDFEPVEQSEAVEQSEVVEQPDASVRYLFPAPPGGQSAAARRLTRFKRRIDGMLAEMLGDDSDEAAEPSTAEPSTAGRSTAERSPAEPDETFWGPGERRDSAPSAGYRSKHRMTDPVREPRRSDGQRNVPRHAAPPVSFSAKLTGRYAAHAAW